MGMEHLTKMTVCISRRPSGVNLGVLLNSDLSAIEQVEDIPIVFDNTILDIASKDYRKTMGSNVWEPSALRALPLVS